MCSWAFLDAPRAFQMLSRCLRAVSNTPEMPLAGLFLTFSRRTRAELDTPESSPDRFGLSKVVPGILEPF